MEVMNTEQFEQTEVIVGQTHTTEGFRVSEDPMLMSMLSTGLYANPLRTMIQEVMFNAWDAHRMGNCQHRPIDVYVTDSDLIIRDYGPGIHDDEIHDIFCVYGNSTKRDDSNQTGGFGLGSKSPFAYTESFTVTSCHKGIRSMYFISRSSDDANGKPGRTTIVKTQTEETGLTVTVPIKNFNDMTKIAAYVQDILYLSGIQLNFYYREDKVLKLKSDNLVPGEYRILNYTDRNDQHISDKSSKIYAIYGGVRYEIPRITEYENEYSFLRSISNDNSFYIGFKPDTLTPLPNREGLNMSDKTKETIQQTLELCTEKFQIVIEPLIQALFSEIFKDLKANNTAPQFALMYAMELASDRDRNFLSYFKKIVTPLVPYNSDKNVWKIIINLLVRNCNAVRDIITSEKWSNILFIQFMKQYPESRSKAFNIKNKHIIDDFFGYSYKRDSIIAKEFWYDFSTDLLKFEKDFELEFPEQPTIQPQMRLLRNGVLHKTTRNRYTIKSAVYSKNIKKLSSEIKKKIKLPSTKTKQIKDPERIWLAGNGTEIRDIFLPKTIIVGKTLTDLKEHHINYSQFFTTNYPACSFERNFSRYSSACDYGLIPRYVIHKRKGAYDAAIRILKKHNFNIIEAPEIPKKIKIVPINKAPKVIGYPRVDCRSNSNGWISEFTNLNVEKPSTYFYATPGNISGRIYADIPNAKVMRAFMKVIDSETVMLNNIKQVDVLKRMGAISFAEATTNWWASFSKKKRNMTNIVRIIKILQKSELPNNLYRNQIIQRNFGITKSSVSSPLFWNEVTLIQEIKKDYHTPICKVKNQIEDLIDEVWKKDPLKEAITKQCKATDIFQNYQLRIKWLDLPNHKKQEFAKILVKFMKQNNSL